MARPRKKNWYLTADEIYVEWDKWRRSSDDVQQRVISNVLAKQMYMVATRLMNNPHFARYPQDVKEDMVQEAVLKMVKNLKNMKEEKRDGFFNYFIACAWTACADYLSEYYEEKNKRRELVLDALNKMQCESITAVDPEALHNLQCLVDEYKRDE